MKKTITKLNKTLLATTTSILLLAGSAHAGSDMAKLYEDNCASCHGSDHGGYLAPAINADTLKGRSPTALRSLL